MRTIRDVIGNIIHILDVIDGTKINDEMIQNVLAIYFTSELKSEMLTLLEKYNNILDPKKKNIQGLKPGTVILGPYSSGKSHFALFLAFLFGLKINFDDPTLSEEIPNIREKCWQILEKNSNFGISKTSEFKRLREDNYLVSFISLTNYKEEKNFLSIIVDSLNKALEERNIDSRIGVEVTKKNRGVILGHMKQYYPNKFEEYSNQKGFQIKLRILKDYANFMDLRLKLKNHLEIAEELNQIAKDHNLNGYILFFDEFFRYYNPMEQNEKMDIGSNLQSFAYEIQNSVKLCLFPMSQAPIFDQDAYLQQVERRFTKVNISYKNATSIIHQRIIPEVNLDEVQNFYKNEIKNTPASKRISLDSFKDYYPFHKKTIIDLEAMVGYYANDTKGIINYLWVSLNSYKNKTIENLITADTLHDYFIEDLSSPEITGWELKEKYKEINKLYISSLEDEEKDLTQKILKILLFCTNRSRSWHKDDFYNHFYNVPKDRIEKLLENLVSFIEDQTNFISSNPMRNIFYYNPGSMGDITKYIRIIERSLNEDKVIELYWEESIENEFGAIEFTRRTFEWKKILCKSYCYYPIRNNLRQSIRKSLNLLANIPDKIDINFYEYDKHDIIDAFFLIGNYKPIEKRVIEKIIDEEIAEIDNPNPYLTHSLFYVKPDNFTKDDKKKIKNYYARQICLRIFEQLFQSRNLNWDHLRNTPNLSKFNRVIDETSITTNLKKFKSENDDSINRYMASLRASLNVSDAENVSRTMNNYNKIKIFDSKLRKIELYRSNNWFTYNESFPDIVSDNLNELIPLKYKKLSSLMVTNTKKLFGTSLTKILNLLMDKVFVNEEKFTVKDAQTIQLLDTTFRELNLIKNLNENIYTFNKNISLQYSPYLKHMHTILKQNDNRLEISELLIKYMLPPFGFPKIVTLLSIISLVYMQKYIIEYKDIEITTDIKEFISKKDRKSFKIKKENLNDLVRRGYIAKGDVIEARDFEQVKKIIRQLYHLKSEQNRRCSLLEENNEKLKVFNENIINVKTPSIFEQKFLIELIRNIEVNNNFKNFKSSIISLYDNLRNLLKENEVDKNLELIEVETLPIIQFSEDIKTLIDQVQKIDKTGKNFLIEFLKIFNEMFDNRFFSRKIKSLRDCYSPFSNEEESIIQDLLNGLNFILKTNEVIEQNSRISSYNMILEEIKENLSSSEKFLDFIGSLFDDSNIIILVKSYQEKFLKMYKNFHGQFWDNISKFKEDFETEKFDLLNIFKHLSKLKLGTSISNVISLDDNSFKCNGDFTDNELLENLMCKSCKISLEKSYDLQLAPGFHNLFDIAEIDLSAEEIEFNGFTINLNLSFTTYLSDQIKDIVKYFDYDEKVNKTSFGRKIIENISYKLSSNEDRARFNGYVKSLKEFNYSKVKEIFINQKTIENRDLIVSLLEFLYRISIILYVPSEFLLNQIKSLNDIFEKKGFTEFLNKIIEINLSDLEKIKVNHEIFQLKDLITKDLQPDILEIAKKEIESYIDDILKKYGNLLILPHDKLNVIDEIHKNFIDCDIKLPIIRLNEPKSVDLTASITHNEDHLYSSIEQISIRNPEYKDCLQPFLKRLFSKYFYFGKISNAPKVFDENKIRKLDIYVKEEKKWIKWGNFEVFFGATRENRL